MTETAAGATAQEEKVLAALQTEQSRRAAEADADRRATAAARAMLSRPRQLALPFYLRREAQRAAPRGRTVPLLAMPLALSRSRSQDSARSVGGRRRLVLSVDAPTTLTWRLQLDRAAAACGAFALAPEAWELFGDPLELVVRLTTPESDVPPVVEHVLRIHPAARAMDRRWVPWRIELPALGPATLEFETRAPHGSVDRAWLLLGDPVLDLGVAPRRRDRPARRRRTPGVPPTIALLMPVHDPPLALLEQTLASVVAQRSPHWELCMVDDGSRDPAVITRLQQAAARDGRVHLLRHDEAEGISAATNAAMGMANAPFVATLDHDDLLHPQAIERVAQALARNPEIDVLYSDNDLVAGEGIRFSPALKPDWSPDLLRACMYTLHLGVYRRALVEQIGGWRSAFDGAQDHDLVLRLSEQTTAIAHLPEVLTHWRAHAGSAALGELAKPAAYERGRLAVEEHLTRVGIPGTVERLPWAGRYRVLPERRSPITVVLPAAATDEQIEAWRSALRDGDAVIRSLTTRGDLAAVRAAAPPNGVVVIAEDCAVPERAASIDELAGHVECGGVAAAAGLVLDAEQRVLAGGVAYPQGVPIGLHTGANGDADDRHPSLTMVSNRLGVRGVVAIRAELLHDTEVSDAAGALWLLALTTAVAERGGRVIWAPLARFTSTPESTQRWMTISPQELLALDRGAQPDPFWNPGRCPDRADEMPIAPMAEALG